VPKLVDYAARFEFIREAVCAVVDRSGAAALTQRSVAEELGISLTTIKRLIDSAESLPSLGLELVQRERRNRARSRRDSGLPRAVALLLTQLPTDEESLAHARVWESVTSAHSRDGRVREFREAWSSDCRLSSNAASSWRWLTRRSEHTWTRWATRAGWPRRPRRSFGTWTNVNHE
jgi:hypothetical protein